MPEIERGPRFYARRPSLSGMPPAPSFWLLFFGVQVVVAVCHSVPNAFMKENVKVMIFIAP